MCDADEGLPAAVDCGGDPDILLTISGGTWMGRSPGVYRICPFTYTNSGTSEAWLAASTGDDYFRAVVVVNTASYTSYVKGRDVPSGVELLMSNSASLTSRIKDGAFGTYVLGSGITFTIARGNNW